VLILMDGIGDLGQEPVQGIVRIGCRFAVEVFFAGEIAAEVVTVGLTPSE